MQTKRKRLNDRPNYERILDDTTNLIEIDKSKNYVNNKILKEVREYLTSFLVLKPTDYYKNISKAQLRLLEKYPKFNDDTALKYLELLLQYNNDITYRTQVISAFTFLESYFCPGKFDDYIVNIKEISSKKN